MPEQPVLEIESAAESATPQSPPRSCKSLLQQLVTFIWFTGSLLLAAGRLDWIRGWIWIALCVVGLTALRFIVDHYNPAVMNARTNWRRKDTKRFDKIFLAFYVPLILIHPAVGGLDAGRYHWSSLPFAFVYIGAALLALSLSLIAWVLVVNPFAETSVRLQTDRGQTVITSGPYRLVRHPMYVGAILMYFANPLIWGSVWALVLSGIVACLMIARTAMEDRTLRRELAGYEAYAARTRYRLLPGLW